MPPGRGVASAEKPTQRPANTQLESRYGATHGSAIPGNYYIFCGRQLGKGILQLIVSKGDTIIVTAEAHVEIKDVRGMYERRRVGENSSADRLPVTRVSDPLCCAPPPGWRSGWKIASGLPNVPASSFSVRGGRVSTASRMQNAPQTFVLRGRGGNPVSQARTSMSGSIENLD